MVKMTSHEIRFTGKHCILLCERHQTTGNTQMNDSRSISDLSSTRDMCLLFSFYAYTSRIHLAS